MSDNSISLDALLGSDRTEDLSNEQVLRLFVSSSDDETMVASLMSSGTHLIQGSRGTGKTMFLRVAHERVRRDRSDVAPVFVSFSRYLATYSSTDRPQENYSPFQSWVLAKILAGIRDTIRNMGRTSEESDIGERVPLDKYIQRLEMYYSDASVADPSKNAEELGVSTEDIINFARIDRLQSKIVSLLDRHRIQYVYLFLDEAAQSFAEDRQPEFFQIIKHLRHYRIATKVAVYPHTTNYGPDFDVGQDAIVLKIERPTETQEGVQFFIDFIGKRYAGTELGVALNKSEQQTLFLIKMSGGNPRWFIHLLGYLGHSNKRAISSTSAISAAKELPERNLWPYLNGLHGRLQSKIKYFDVANQLVHVFVEDLRAINTTKGRRDAQSRRPVCFVVVSGHKTVPYRVHAAIRLLQYVGILFSRGPKRITGRETAEMFILHPAIQLRENTLFPNETNPTLESVVTALTDPAKEDFREYTRNSPRFSEFKEPPEDETLCSSCNARLPSDARFCMKCGKPIAIKSLYEELLQAPVGALEITPGIKSRLIQDSRFSTVGSILKATDEMLDSIHGIGPERLKLIRYAAEEYVAGLDLPRRSQAINSPQQIATAAEKMRSTRIATYAPNSFATHQQHLIGSRSRQPLVQVDCRRHR